MRSNRISHQSHRGQTDIWLTPPEIIHALGAFDLDPCTSEIMPWKTAARRYWADGLTKPWEGRVWLNPPYGPETYIWLDKMSHHKSGVALVFARVETKGFFRTVWDRAKGILFLRGRIWFYRADGTRAKGNAGAPSILIAWSDEDCEILKTCGLAGRYVAL